MGARPGLLALLTVLSLVGCASGSGDPGDALRNYTDSGDGCRQVVSAISYADARLQPLGQEAYQHFTAAGLWSIFLDQLEIFQASRRFQPDQSHDISLNLVQRG